MPSTGQGDPGRSPLASDPVGQEAPTGRAAPEGASPAGLPVGDAEDLIFGGPE